jgi:hypothetical protein
VRSAASAASSSPSAACTCAASACSSAGVGGVVGEQGVEGRERSLSLALLGLELGQREIQPAAQRHGLLVVAGQLGAGLLDEGASLPLLGLGEQRRDAHQPRLGAVRVEALGLRQRGQRALQVTELKFGLGAQHQRVGVLFGFDGDSVRYLASARRVAQQERDARERQRQIGASGMTADSVLQQPAGLRRVARPDQELRQFKLGVRCVFGGGAKVVDGPERRLAVAAGDRLLDGLASLLRTLLGRCAPDERNPEDGGDEQAPRDHATRSLHGRFTSAGGPRLIGNEEHGSRPWPSGRPFEP